MIDQFEDQAELLKKIEAIYTSNLPQDRGVQTEFQPHQLPLIEAYKDHRQAVNGVINFPENEHTDPVAVGLEYVRTLMKLGEEGVQLIYPKDDNLINPQPTDQAFMDKLHEIYNSNDIHTIATFLHQESSRVAPVINAFTHVDGKVLPALKQEFEFRTQFSKKLAEVSQKIEPNAPPKLKPLIIAD